ncbi:MAG: acetate kinase [Marinifilaceae bacterium]|nr:acetate kinase [Marinifilaceae bacterium]
MNILVLNCGSSSIKYQLIDMSAEPNVLAKGLCEKIGLPEGIFTHKPANGKSKLESTDPIPNHSIGINMILKALLSEENGVISSLEEINAVGHRVAHGGEFFDKSVIIDNDVKKKIEACCEIAPLHNPAHLEGINAMEEILPNVPQTAVFDTSFHQTMPKEAYTYAIPYRYYTDYKVRRYGFHGTSHKFVAEKACNILDWNIEDKKIITCHLGNGASICAIDGGKSVDTSMGFTPNEGLEMGTRTGNLDLGALLYIQEKDNLNSEQTNHLINKESGMFGVSGVSSDCRDLEQAAEAGNERAQLALDIFSYKVRKYVGAYAAVLGGVDLIIFTGGIGENDSNARFHVCEKLGYMGVDFDQNANDGQRGVDKVLSKDDSRVKVMMIATDEELVIAKDTLELVK